MHVGPREDRPISHINQAAGIGPRSDDEPEEITIGNFQHMKVARATQEVVRPVNHHLGEGEFASTILNIGMCLAGLLVTLAAWLTLMEAYRLNTSPAQVILWAFGELRTQGGSQ